MKCKRCGKAVRAKREAFHYTACGLPDVTLLNVEVRRCAACGGQSVAIPRIEELHRLIALAVARKGARLTPAEIRYLRKYLGLSGRDFAAKIGVAPATVSRWESDAAPQPMGGTAERLLRLMAMAYPPVSAYPVDFKAELPLEQVALDAPASLRLSVQPGRKGWQEAA